MSKLITVFCESFGNSKVILLDNIISKIKFEHELMIVALTPLACYQLEILDIGYTTVEMFCSIQEETFDPSKQLNTRLKVFQLYDFEKQRAKKFWSNFLNNYIETMYKNSSPYFIYFGKSTTGLAYELSNHKKLRKAFTRTINLSK